MTRLIGPRRRHRGAPGVTVALAVALVGTAACVTTSDTAQRDAGVYAAVVRWFAAGADPETRIFLDGQDDPEIDLAVQAEVVFLLDELESVRFIDAAEEAVDESLPGVPVRDSGVFLLLGPVRGDRTATVQVTRYLSEDESQDYLFTVRRRQGVWEVEGRPEMVQSGG